MKHENSEKFDLDQLLHPSEAFSRPSEVANDPDLTLNEKRAILASWASDPCAAEAAPALRQRPGGPAVPVDEVLEALCALDHEAHQQVTNLGQKAASPRGDRSLCHAPQIQRARRRLNGFRLKGASHNRMPQATYELAAS
jgi:hypothetical protein